MNKNKRKEDIKKLLLEESVSSYGRIYQLIQTGKLDKIIDKINDEKTETIVSSIVKKGYLTGNEQFLDIIANFICFFDRYFPTISHRDYILECIFDSDYIPDFLLCKKYWGDNDNIPYFIYQIKRYVIYNFSLTIKKIGNHFNKNVLSLLNNKIDIDLNDEEEVNKIFDLIQNICWTNINSYSLIFLFSNWNKSLLSLEEMMKKNNNDISRTVEVVSENFITHFEIVFDNYKKNKSILNYVKNM